MTIMQMDPSKLKAPDVSIEDLYNGLAKIRPSVAPGDLDRQVDFTNNFGSDG